MVLCLKIFFRIEEEFLSNDSSVREGGPRRVRGRDHWRHRMERGGHRGGRRGHRGGRR